MYETKLGCPDCAESCKEKINSNIEDFPKNLDEFELLMNYDPQKMMDLMNQKFGEEWQSQDLGQIFGMLSDALGMGTTDEKDD